MDSKAMLKKVNDNQKMIVEVIVMSLISGWFLTNFIFKTYKVVENVEYISKMNTGAMFLIMFLVAIVAGIVYFMEQSAAKIMCFISVYAYSIASINENSENIYYALVVIIITVLAFIYVKDDIIKVLNKIKINDNASVVIVAILGVALSVFIGVITVLRYETYSNSTFDFGIFAQMFESMKNTGQPTTTVERAEMGSFSHFGVHFSPIFYAMLPFYFLFPSPVTVQVMQAVVLGLAVIPLYFLCRHYNLTAKISLMLCLIYCIFPAVASGTYYDFHENCCIPILLFSLILMIEKKKDPLIFVFALLLVMVKEDAAFYLFVLGVYFLLSKRDKKRGLIMTVLALAYFVLALKIVHSFGLGDVSDFRYNHIMYDKDGGLSQIIVTILVNPAYVLSKLFTEDKLKYFILMVFPMGTALFQKKKYSRYILLSTFVVINLIPDYQYMYDIGFQYNFGVVALMMYIAIMTASEWKRDRKVTWVMTSFVITSVLFVSFTFQKWDVYTSRYEDNKKIYLEMNKALEVIPEGASVLTSGFIMPHLYYVEDLTVIRGDYQVDQDYVVVDLRSGYSSDIEEVGPKLVEYTMVVEVPDTLRIYTKNK